MAVAVGGGSGAWSTEADDLGAGDVGDLVWW